MDERKLNLYLETGQRGQQTKCPFFVMFLQRPLFENFSHFEKESHCTHGEGESGP